MVFPSLAYNSELQNKLKSNFLNSKFVKVSKSDNKLFKTVIDSNSVLTLHKSIKTQFTSLIVTSKTKHRQLQSVF